MEQKKRKPCNKFQPYSHKPQTTVDKDAPATSVKPLLKEGQENLTLHHWLTVFTFIDDHLSMVQANIVALKFISFFTIALHT
jgi:hypothetical protein